jgi:hypothetical protein
LHGLRANLAQSHALSRLGCPERDAALTPIRAGRPRTRSLTLVELEAEFAKEINRPSEVFDDDSYVVHPLERHVSSKVSFHLQGVADLTTDA